MTTIDLLLEAHDRIGDLQTDYNSIRLDRLLEEMGVDKTELVFVLATLARNRPTSYMDADPVRACVGTLLLGFLLGAKYAEVKDESGV